MRFISAEKIFDGHAFLPGGSVLVLDDSGSLKDVVTADTVDRQKVEHLKGTITPGFVNVHCHLELSHMKNLIPQHTGLPSFGKQVITQRNNHTADEVQERMHAADLEMLSNGIVAVGDIGNGDESFAVKSQSNIFYHSFIELIGLKPEHADSILENGKLLFKKLTEKGLKGSLVPHAPYSTSKRLIKKIADFDEQHQLPFSIHNQETEEEARFFMGEQSGFHDLYQFLNLDISWFNPPGTSSLQDYAEALSSVPSVLVHNTMTKKEDVDSVKNKNVYWCFCPCANLYIENKLPDFSVFKAQKEKICLGTDSLAGNLHLDLVKEANVILKESSVFSEEEVLSAMTANGAEALGITELFGGLIKGKNAGLNLLNTENGQLHFIKKIV